MRRLFLLTPLVATASFAHADCRVASTAASSSELKIIVPFAVPVGVPVAPFAPYFYSYQEFQPRAVAGACDSGRGMTVAGVSDPGPPASMKPAAAPAQSLLATRCATCHSGPTPKAGLSLEHPDQLTAATRLAAIRAIATGRMPKDKPLSPDDSRRIIEELSTEQ